MKRDKYIKILNEIKEHNTPFYLKNTVKNIRIFINDTKK